MQLKEKKIFQKFKNYNFKILKFKIIEQIISDSIEKFILLFILKG